MADEGPGIYHPFTLGQKARRALGVLAWLETMPTRSKEDYTREEMIVLARARRQSGRTCRNCEWHLVKGKNRGCFPEGRYRKWLSPEEFDAGCAEFVQCSRE